MLFDASHTSIDAAYIMERLGMKRSTAYRYIQSLRDLDLLYVDPKSGSVRLGPRNLELARITKQALGLSDVSRPVMRQLARETNATVLLRKRFDTNLVTVDRIDGDPQAAVRVNADVGHVIPVTVSASGRVLLAWEDADEIRNVLDRVAFMKITPETIADRRTFERALKRTRADGHALAQGEMQAGIIAAAAPIRDLDGDVVASLSAAAVRGANNAPEQAQEFVDPVVTAAHLISERLGAAIP